MKRRIALLIAVVLMIAALLPAAQGEYVSSEVKQELLGQTEAVLENVKALRKQLLAPATMTLNDDVLTVFCGEDSLGGSVHGEYTLTLIRYTCSNEYGVPIQDLAVFDGTEYIGSRADIEALEEAADQKMAQAEIAGMKASPQSATYMADMMGYMKLLKEASDLQNAYAKYGTLLDITYETASEYLVSNVARTSGEWIAEELGIEYVEY